MPIKHPDLYDAVYSALRGMVASIPMRKPTGQPRVFRHGENRHEGPAGLVGANRVRTVFESSTNDNNRWTGPRPRPVQGPKPAAGGVYTSLGMNDALLGELTYSNKALKTTVDEDVQRKLSGKSTSLTAQNFLLALSERRIFEFEFPQALPIADLSLSSLAGQHLMEALGRVPAVQAALRTARYATVQDAYLASADHSLPRAMGQLVRDQLPGCRAIWVSSARASSAVQMQDTEGDNIIFFGLDKALIGELRPIREIWFEKKNGLYKDMSAPIP